MNFLKKKLKPLTAGFNQQASGQSGGNQRWDLEDDLYDEYVVEAPPHPSELLALGVEPTEIDANDPDKLRELYRKAKEEGKDKATNSVLLARQRQKEEIEEKKRTREEWKFFDSLTSRVEQVVKESQKNLDHWKESSAVSELAEPEYELRQTADEVFKPVTAVKLEKGQNDWINFGDDHDDNNKQDNDNDDGKQANKSAVDDEFGCPPGERRRKSSVVVKPSEFVVDQLLEDLGIDLRTAEQKRTLEETQRKKAEAEENRRLERERQQVVQPAARESPSGIDIKAAARPRPRRKGAPRDQEEPPEREELEVHEAELDPFQTSFVSKELLANVRPNAEIKPTVAVTVAVAASAAPESKAEQSKFIDPFDTSYVNLE